MLNQFNASIWGDEGFSAILSMKSIPEIIRIVANDTSPPLYNITEHLAFQAFGTSEVVIRGLSFFYYLIAIFFVYLIGTYLWDKRTGVLAAALSFFNPFFFIYAFEGRMYSILAAGVVASMYFFIRLILTKKPQRRDQIGYILATSWALYSHHFAIFALFLQGLWFIYEFVFGKRKNAIQVFLSFIAIGIIYIPWLIPLYNQISKVGSGFWLGTPTVRDLGNLFFDYLGKGIMHPLASIALYATAAGLIIRKWEKAGKKTIILVSWFIVPIVVTWLVSQVFQSIFFNRYLIHSIPAGMLVLASNKRGVLSAATIGVVLGLFVVIDFNYFINPTKQPFRELAAYVKETKRGDDFLINWGAGSHKLWETKYYDIPAPIFVPDGGELPFFVGTALMEEGDIISEIPNKPFRVGVVTSGNVDEIEIPGYTLGESRDFSGVKFAWFER